MRTSEIARLATALNGVTAFLEPSEGAQICSDAILVPLRRRLGNECDVDCRTSLDEAIAKLLPGLDAKAATSHARAISALMVAEGDSVQDDVNTVRSETLRDAYG